MIKEIRRKGKMGGKETKIKGGGGGVMFTVHSSQFTVHTPNFHFTFSQMWKTDI